MRVISEEGEFDLPSEFSCRLTRSNVLLSSAGEQTNPITLPPSPNNLKLVGWSDRIDSTFKLITDIDVVVMDRLFVRKCNLGILAAPSKKEGVTSTLYFDTGDFYSRVEDTPLSSLAWPTMKHPDFNNVSAEERVSYLVSLLKSEYMTPTADALFGIVPVLTSQEFTYKMNKLQPNGSYKVTDVTGLFILNGFERYQHILDFTGGTTDYLDTFEAEFQQTLVINSVAITVGKGYGMTPFLKLRYMIVFIFDKYGYTADLTEIDSIIDNFELEKALVYNNVADAIYTGILKFKQLVPDVTIKEFISEFETRFCGKFVIDNNRKKAKFVLYSSAISAPADIDLTAFACADAEIDKTEFTSIKIKDKSDNASTADSEKVTTIEIQLMNSVTITDQFSATGVANNILNADLNILQGDEIIQLNTQFEVDKKSTSNSQPKASDLIQYMYMDNSSWIDSINATNAKLKYKTSHRLYKVSPDPDLTVMTNLYKVYKNFRLNSNVAFKPLEMNISPKLLEQINIHIPKILQGQKVMIESIEQVLGKDDLQTVTFRSIRPFNNRIQHIGVWSGFMCELNGLNVNLKDIFISAVKPSLHLMYVSATDNVTSDLSVQVKITFNTGAFLSTFLTIAYGQKQSSVVSTEIYSSLPVISVVVSSINITTDAHSNYYIKN